MKKLRKVKTNLQDSIEAYEGICNCVMDCGTCFCHCVGGPLESNDDSSSNYATLESKCLSISNSHWSWA